jgi:hypothetical protein
VTTYEEWRVTGEPGTIAGTDVRYPSYDFTFGSAARRALGKDKDPEAAARWFIAMIRDANHREWEDGPRLHRRTVTVTDWVPVDE